MIQIIPNKKQWTKWSLPSKLTALAFYLAIGAIAISLISYTSIKGKEFLSSRIGIKKVIIDSTLIQKYTGGQFSKYGGYINISYPKITYYLSNPFLEYINDEVKNNALFCLDSSIIEYNFEYKIGLVTPYLLTIKMDQYYYYFLAANGNASIIAINIDPSSNRIIDFFDVFDPRRNALIGIKTLIEKQLKKDYDGYFKEEFDRASYIPRFFIKDESIEFVFSEYEITPGAYGSFCIDIPYKEVIEFIKPDGPLGLLASPSGTWYSGDHFVNGVMKYIEKMNTDNISDTFIIKQK